MAWTTPKTWTAEVLTSSDMNTHLRDNLEALKDPPSDNYELNEGSDYTTSSSAFVDVDATNLAMTITTNGGDVMVHFHGWIGTSSTIWYFDIDVDGAPIGSNDGIIKGSGNANVGFTRLIPGLSAGSHTFKLQWKVTASTAVLYAGAGTANNDLHPQMWVREVS